ncbi:protein ALTERED PHOSPHATE STARVATION RESPONSE 1 isoform X2 [Brassica rapa]|uniref:protein ALTERED PHOSPHATE STARVATION RESPONSE 1 isoform X2 n=1 Tax=Brassica campestris TaxID=3711 RepID=UPI0004F165CC|nr:protein ALTERED PHOSPHATE STARVATION RESPONSE 1 isoform X2 [Brassica rapa]
MGCSHSKLDDEEAVQICKDRKRFIKQAIQDRTKFASGHIAYINSLRQVSDALHDFIQGDNNYKPHEFVPAHDSFEVTPVKRIPPSSSRRRSTSRSGCDEFITISPSSMPPKMIQEKPRTKVRASYLMANRSRPVRVEQRSPETFRVESFPPPSSHQYGEGEGDGFFGMNVDMNVNTSAASSSSFWNPLSSPEQRLSTHNIPPPSPQNSQWDFFWNPFSSLDYYGYNSNYDRGSVETRSGTVDDEIRGLRRVREEEGIPDLEEDDEPQPPRFQNHNLKANEDSRGNVDKSCCKEEVKVEDVDDDDEDEDEDEDDDDDDDEDGEFTDSGCESENEGDEKCVGEQEQRTVEVPKAETKDNVVGVGTVEEVKNVVNVAKRDTPGFTAYVNRRPTSMAEVIKDLEDQFTTICDAAKEVSGLLEASRAQYAPSPNDHTMKKLNPVALFRSGSSRSSSSRFLLTSSGGSGSESRSDVSDESCMVSGSHQTTLDKLFAWEKKLYDEVKSGERVRRAYEKKCMQLRNQDVKGDDPFAVDKTRATIRDLDTQIKVSIHSIESISKRIETLRDQELLPQLLELVHGLTRMWQVMAESHQIQRRTLDEAKMLLAGAPVSKRHKKRQPPVMPEAINSQRLAQSALNLEAHLRNWRACFEFWITSQRSYMAALSGWLLRCLRCDPDPEKVRLSSCPHPIYRVCIQWSKLLNSLEEKPVLDKLEFFASGMGSVYARQVREDPSWSGSGGSRRYSGSESLDLVLAEDVVMTPEKLAEVAVKVLCHGMSVAVSSLAEFAIYSADEHSKLVNQPEDTSGQRPDVNFNS